MASVIFALLADKTRNEVRARASAFFRNEYWYCFLFGFCFSTYSFYLVEHSSFFKLISFLSFISLGVVILFVQDTKTQA